MFLFSIILGLLAAACSLQSGVAARALTATTRSTDITCGGRFPKAGDGFAKRPDGCSSISDNPDEVRDHWGSANFGGVCNEHDRCYYTIGANVDECNDNFCSGLRKACRNAYCTKILGQRVCEPVTYTACTGIAEVYCAAVKPFAARIYRAAQDLQKSYNACIAEHGGIAPPSPPCSNGQPEGATWIGGGGTSCGIVTYACRNGQIVRTGSVRSPGCVVN